MPSLSVSRSVSVSVARFNIYNCRTCERVINFGSAFSDNLYNPTIPDIKKSPQGAQLVKGLTSDQVMNLRVLKSSPAPLLIGEPAFPSVSHSPCLGAHNKKISDK